MTEKRREHRFTEGRTELGHEQGRVHECNLDHEAGVSGRQRAVDHPAGEQRSDQLHSGLDDDASQRRDDQRAVRTHVRQEPPHEARVVRFAECVVVGR